MKIIKQIVLFAFLISVMALTACDNNQTDGMVCNIEGENHYWTEEEIQNAMNTVEAYFVSNSSFDGWYMEEIRYSSIEDEWCKKHSENNPEQTVILIRTDVRTGIFSDGGNKCYSGCTYSWKLKKVADAWEVISVGQP